MNAASVVQRLAGISGALAVAAGAYGAHGKCPFWEIVFCLADWTLQTIDCCVMKIA